MSCMEGMRQGRLLMNRKVGIEMMEKYEGQAFLENAVESAEKVRKVHYMLSGGEAIPEYGSMLGDIYYGIADMIQEYLSQIGMRIADDDAFNNMTTEIMFAKRDEINGIIGRYCG